MEVKAKTAVNCDSCKVRMILEEDIDGEFIQAKLKNSQGEYQDYDFCDDVCLSNFLQKRNKPRKRKKSKAQISCFNGKYEVKMVKE